ncbi:WS/DGAT/MGAT family O-acyltransferase [Nocardioides marmoribigeumensis]|uniref:Diacylglycerol O-acyltransferase n=1 Tax=Nocardioides marmoribigeumensis TaxID=433649 RepID=A0ABU2C0A3_9ACTN|nr:wax ester/triacylglycerol synthase family O-acyltransferase [Nocardioides marmoribigeumensis]MDR7364039.1 diacylglycerol O-acyltransferase [Nocardioides marmoribigeumensis]
MERLRPGDVALLDIESGGPPMHVATVEVFEPGPEGFDHARLLALIGDRLAFVPRYRQRLLPVPGGLAAPVWVDDADFDLTYHVRESAVPRPGTMAQLEELVSRIIARPLDRSRPLWEMYLIEGLEDGRVAILAKSHQTLVDGVSTIDLGQVILDHDTVARERIPDDWVPRREPSALSMLAAAAQTRAAAPDVTAPARAVARAALRHNPLALGVRAGRSAPESPLQTTLSQQRRFHTVRTDLDDYRQVRRFHGATVNDVVLATVTGALRFWLMTRAESVHSSRQLRAMVPMSVLDNDLEPTSLGSQVTGTVLALPIGESSPVVRLHQVSYALKAHKDTGKAVSALRLIGVGGFAPTTFHALGARVAADSRGREFNLVVTNVPGPQFPLYAAGARMLETYPAQPLLPDHAMAIGVTSYDGGVYYGITADRDAIPDVDVVGQCLSEALAELVDTTSETRMRAPRGRTADGPLDG